MIDLGIEVRAHPDQFSAEPEAGAAASLWVDGVAVPWARAGLDAHEVAGARMWVDEATSEHVLLRAVAVQPLLVRGSVVIGTGLSAVQAGSHPRHGVGDGTRRGGGARWPRTPPWGDSGPMTEAVLLVGGQGTRLRPLTINTPKPMLPVAGVPCTEHQIARAREAGVTRIVLGTSYKAEVVPRLLRRRREASASS